MSDPIENKVAKSGLITLDLNELKPTWLIGEFDMATCLEEGLILREKAFRAFVKSNDWSAFAGEHVCVFCSTDAIVPTWAYMLIADALEPHVKSVMFAERAKLEESLWMSWANELDLASYQDRRVVIKGCSDEAIPVSVYMVLTQRLKSVALSVMFGEPCSTVPIFKRPKQASA